jgi:hypothetical protein
MDSEVEDSIVDHISNFFIIRPGDTDHTRIAEVSARPDESAYMASLLLLCFILGICYHSCPEASRISSSAEAQPVGAAGLALGCQPRHERWI